MILVIFLLVGAALVVGPWFVHDLAASVQVGSSVVGLAILIGVLVISVIVRLYRKASANMAFVRTGMGGVQRDSRRRHDRAAGRPPRHPRFAGNHAAERRAARAARPDHQATTCAWICRPSSTSRSRPTPTTSCRRPARWAAETCSRTRCSELVQEKLVSALRTVAATKELVELHCQARRVRQRRAGDRDARPGQQRPDAGIGDDFLARPDRPDAAAGTERLRRPGPAEDRRDHAEGARRAQRDRARSASGRWSAKNVSTTQEGARPAARPGGIRGRAEDEGRQCAGRPRARGGGVQDRAGRGDRPARDREDARGGDHRGASARWRSSRRRSPGRSRWSPSCASRRRRRS